jgi:phosphoribosylanthranilate isomerase
MLVIKAVAVHSREDIARWEPENSAKAAGSSAGRTANVGRSPEILRAGPNFLLLDHSAGGTGERFDWKRVLGGDAADEGVLPYFIAGGINDNNIREALSLELFGMKPLGIDVSSGAETDGVKDRDKIARLVEMVRQYGGQSETEGQNGG